MPKVRLAELKPIAQVAPIQLSLPTQQEAMTLLQLGDLMKMCSG